MIDKKTYEHLGNTSCVSAQVLTELITKPESFADTHDIIEAIAVNPHFCAEEKRRLLTALDMSLDDIIITMMTIVFEDAFEKEKSVSYLFYSYAKGVLSPYEWDIQDILARAYTLDCSTIELRAIEQGLHASPK